MLSHRLVRGYFGAAAILSAAATVILFIFMAVLGWPVITDGAFPGMLLSPWSPDHQVYGIRPMVAGTLWIAGLGLLISIPLSLGCAVFVHLVRAGGAGGLLLKLVRIMTGIPTVVYGFVGIFLLVPMVREIFGRGSGLCILTAALMLAILIAPTMILFFVDGLNRVPRAYSLSVAALGGTRVQQLLYVMLPQAWPGIVAGIVLGFGRAVGDTMIALMLAGNAVALPESVLDPARTLTAHIALVVAADFDSPEFRALFVCGLVLYLVTTLAAVAMRRIGGNAMEAS